VGIVVPDEPASKSGRVGDEERDEQNGGAERGRAGFEHFLHVRVADPDDTRGAPWRLPEADRLSNPTSDLLLSRLRGVSRMKVYKVLIKCRVTGKVVDTGVEVSSPEEFAPAIYVGPRVECPHCGQVHAWVKEEAFLQVDDNVTTGRLWRPNR
jgi:hypothetical protein